MSVPRLLLTLLLVLFLFGCKKEQHQAPVQTKAQNFKGDSCAACGMILREQSSPRGQVVHRDGKRAYFCSISDMLSYLEAPSPHGRAKAIYVEFLSPKANPKTFATASRPWLAAEKAIYVLGVAKPRVMGVPILTYETERQARYIAQKWKGKVFRWKQLKPAWKKLRAK